MNKKIKKQWWEDAFDDKYLKTYVDIVTPKMTDQQMHFLLKELDFKKNDEILDLGCGYGRHAIELAKNGYNVTGVDTSKKFIDIAKKEAQKNNVKIDFLIEDMRNLSFINKFDVIINMFTSFGYFDDESDNELVIQKIHTSLKPNGKFLIDLNNGISLLNRIMEKGGTVNKTGIITNVVKTTLSNNLTVENKEELDLLTMRWAMKRNWKEGSNLKIYKTNVRIFFLPEINAMLKRNGFLIEKLWGDFQGSEFAPGSWRLIILAKKI